MRQYLSLVALLVTLVLAAGLDRLLLAQRQLVARTFSMGLYAWPALLANMAMAGCWLVLAWLVVFRRPRNPVAALLYVLLGLLVSVVFLFSWLSSLALVFRNPWPALFPNWPPAPNTLLGQAG